MKAGDVVLAYNCIPMIHYVTKTVPALGNPWPTLLIPGELEIKLGKLSGKKQFPKVIVRAKTNTRDRRWGMRNVSITYTRNKRTVEDLKILDDFVQQYRYYEVWSNADFVIYEISLNSEC